VRKGIYANGIFKFRVNLPLHYGDPQVWPAITFTSKVYNPLVHPESGEVDLTLLLPSWDPRAGSCMLTALTYLKKVSKIVHFSCACLNSSLQCYRGALQAALIARKPCEAHLLSSLLSSFIVEAQLHTMSLVLQMNVYTAVLARSLAVSAISSLS
jgi:Ubiquitin-conjugating enzyme